MPCDRNVQLFVKLTGFALTKKKEARKEGRKEAKKQRSKEEKEKRKEDVKQERKKRKCVDSDQLN